MSLLKQIKTIIALKSTTKMFTKTFSQAWEKKTFVDDGKLNLLFEKVKKPYAQLARDYVLAAPLKKENNNDNKNPPQQEIARTAFYFYTIMAATVFNVLGDFKSSNKLAQYYIDNMQPNYTLNPQELEALKTTFIGNNLRILIEEKDLDNSNSNFNAILQNKELNSLNFDSQINSFSPTPLLPDIKIRFEELKSELFSLPKKPTILGDIALYYFAIDNLKESARYLKERLNKEGSVEKIENEIYENQGLRNSPTGQKYFQFIRDFIENEKKLTQEIDYKVVPPNINNNPNDSTNSNINYDINSEIPPKSKSPPRR